MRGPSAWIPAFAARILIQVGPGRRFSHTLWRPRHREPTGAITAGRDSAGGTALQLGGSVVERLYNLPPTRARGRVALLLALLKPRPVADGRARAGRGGAVGVLQVESVCPRAEHCLRLKYGASMF